jgi:hypothetical protein
MNTHRETIASRLDGYLLAIAELKGDGTFFQCRYLGETSPARALALLCNALTLPATSVQLVEPDVIPTSGVPNDVKHWIMQRRRIVNPDDADAIDERLFDGFMNEMVDLLGSTLSWYQLGRLNKGESILHLGALWDVFVFGNEDCAFVLHCSWDS